MSFKNVEQFVFLNSLQAHWEEIREEYTRMDNLAQSWHEPIYNQGWNVIGFLFQGKPFPNNKKLAPVTSSVMDNIAGIHTYGFSIMEPGCEIHPHVGYTSEVLRGHLALYSNPDAALKVGDEIRNWNEGEVFVFDDTTLHSAWNRGDVNRVVLLFDFYKEPSLREG